MNLADLLREKLSSWKPAGDGRHSWTEAGLPGGWAVHIAADHADVVGCLVWELTLTRTGEPPAGRTLRQWANSAAGRCPGLTEDLKLLELDDAAAEAVLRSDVPVKAGEAVAYYEVRLTGLSTATVRRYRATGTRREQVAFALTHEALANLAGRLAQ